MKHGTSSGRYFTGPDVCSVEASPICAFVSYNVVIDVTPCNFPISIHLQPDPQANRYNWPGPAN